MVTLYVGTKRKKFIAHKKLICCVDFFDKAFNGPFKEGQEGLMYLPEDSSGAISLFLDWLYRGVLPSRSSDEYLENLYNLYFCAAKLNIVNLKDMAMDKIQDVFYDLDKRIDLDLVARIYKNTSDFCGLRYFGGYLYLYQHFKDKKKSDRKMKRSNAKESNPKSFFNLEKIDYQDIWEKSKEEFDLFHSLMEYIIYWEADNGDPRDRDEDNKEDRCRYHDHDEDYPCRPAEDEDDET